jgi:hypothetical protein
LTLGNEANNGANALKASGVDQQYAWEIPVLMGKHNLSDRVASSIAGRTMELPGKARSADEVMEDYRQYRSRLNPVLAPLLVPDPENIYRWRVQYECGRIEEQLATNDNVEWLLAHSHTDPLSRERLPAGQFLRHPQHGKESQDDEHGAH